MEQDPNVHDHRGRVSNANANRGCGSSIRKERGEKFVATQALLVSSEPLTGMRGGLDRWELLPSNSMIVAAPVRPTVGRCTRAALVAKLKEISIGGGKRHNLSESSAPVLEIEVKCIRSLCRDALGDACPDGARGTYFPFTTFRRLIDHTRLTLSFYSCQAPRPRSKRWAHPARVAYRGTGRLTPAGRRVASRGGFWWWGNEIREKRRLRREQSSQQIRVQSRAAARRAKRGRRRVVRNPRRRVAPENKRAPAKRGRVIDALAGLPDPNRGHARRC